MGALPGFFPLSLNPRFCGAIRGLTFTSKWGDWAGPRWSKHHFIRLKTLSPTPEFRFRDQPRPDKEDSGGCDIGAYESQTD